MANSNRNRLELDLERRRKEEEKRRATSAGNGNITLPCSRYTIRCPSYSLFRFRSMCAFNSTRGGLISSLAALSQSIVSDTICWLIFISFLSYLLYRVGLGFLLPRAPGARESSHPG